jgi:hypothetical protein
MSHNPRTARPYHALLSCDTLPGKNRPTRLKDTQQVLN